MDVCDKGGQGQDLTNLKMNDAAITHEVRRIPPPLTRMRIEFSYLYGCANESILAETKNNTTAAGSAFPRH